MLDANPEEMQSEKPAIPTCIFYTVFETALLLGVAQSSVYDMHHDGVLTIRKIGKRSKILKSEICEFIKNSVMSRGVDRSRAVGKYHPRKKTKTKPAA